MGGFKQNNNLMLVEPLNDHSPYFVVVCRVGRQEAWRLDRILNLESERWWLEKDL